MARCPQCRRENAPFARFCGHCGQPFIPSNRPTPKRRRDGGVWVVVIIAAALFFGFRPFHFNRIISTLTSRTNATRRNFDLSTEKATAFFNLLAPDDVKVIVRRRSRGVSIKGTSREVAVLNDFVALLTRYEHDSSSAALVAVQQLGEPDAVKTRYRLPHQQAEALIALLAAKDVPVLVSGRGCEVHVTASAADQRVIHDVVEILLGRQ